VANRHLAASYSNAEVGMGVVLVKGIEGGFNVDLANGFAYWNEKVPDDREQLLRGMAEY
jgi:hypothetical protein